jgi:hypothetical protein
MTATSRVLAFLGMPAAVLGAVLPWLPGIPGTAVPFAALAAPHAMAAGHAGIGVGWAVIAAAAVGALAALLRGRAVLGFVATVQLLLVADFLVLQAIRSAPGDYTAADIPAGCWTVLASALAALVACLSSRPPSRPRPGACQ